MGANINYYELLGVKQSSIQEEIQKAYKQQMKIWHPDVNSSTDANEMSKKINKAKEVLLNSNKREEYDRWLNLIRKEDYERFKNTRGNNKNRNSNENIYMSKWEYFRYWFVDIDCGFLWKIIGVIGVILETLLCLCLSLILKLLHLILGVVSYISRLMGGLMINFITFLFGTILIVCIGIIVYSLIETGDWEVAINSFKDVIIGEITLGALTDNKFMTILLGALGLIFLSVGLECITKKIFTEKIYTYLHNDLNVYLFKKCLRYQDNKG